MESGDVNIRENMGLHPLPPPPVEHELKLQKEKTDLETEPQGTPTCKEWAEKEKLEP